MTSLEASPVPADAGEGTEGSPLHTADRYVMLEGATWSDYQRLIELRGENSAPRLTYLEGRLEIMAPSFSHESIRSMIGRLVEAWCIERGVDLTPAGSWTLENKEFQRGAEPDECYIFGDVPERIPERPDLVIEVVWTSGGLRKLDVYRQLGVREVWTWKEKRILIHELVGEYCVERQRSVHLPELDLELLLPYVDVRPMTRALREYLAALRC